MRLRCDSRHAGHACSLFLDWLGHHPGDHAAHDGHDPARPVLATWPNDGAASKGIPVRAAPAAAPVASPPPAPAARAAPARTILPRLARYVDEITDWDLLPDA